MVFGVSMLIPAYYSAVLDLTIMKQAFLRSSVIVLVVSYLIGYLLIDRKSRGDSREHLLSIIIIYLFLPFVLALPLYQSAFWLTPLQSVYEMLSSLTTTGATLVTSVGRFQAPIFIYTTIVAWLGGFLFLMIAFAVFQPNNIGGFELESQISMTQRVRSIGGGLGESDRYVHYFKILAPPYIALTLLSYLLHSMNGERSLFAFVLAFSSVSTSGLDPYFGQAKEGNMFFSEFIIYIALALGATRHFWLYSGRWRNPGKLTTDPEVRALTVILVIFTLCAVLAYLAHQFYEGHQYLGLSGFFKATWGAIFTGMSFITTHGQVSDFWQFGAMEGEFYLPNIVLLGMVIIGGGIATTAAGVKLLRIYALFKLSQREVTRLVDPHAIAASGVAGRNLRRGGAVNAILYLVLFVAAMILAVLILTFVGMGLHEAILTAIMSASNCGPVLELFPEALINLRSMHPIFYVVSGFTMIFGRIEVLIFIINLSRSFWVEQKAKSS